MSPRALPFLAAPLALLLAVDAAAQFDDQWLAFQSDPALLGAAGVSSTTTEVDFAAGDLDNDGRLDLVVVRKEPATAKGKRTNLLLMNVGGALVDRTAVFAAASDVAGDAGFLTATNDRDVEVVDVDVDGWPDVVTATELSDGDPKHVGHPRVYRNLGGGPPWAGLRHEDARVPQLLTAGGLAVQPRFTAFAAGDVSGDGAPDLYFVDHDSSGAGGAQQPVGHDLDDRLLVNDGNGYFTDGSAASMTPTMLLSAFGSGCAMADFDQDGALDVVKTTSLNAPQYGAIAYNDPAQPGQFAGFDPFHVGSPYAVAAGDLDGDGRPDLVFTEAGSDRYRLNQGVAGGAATWSPARTFDFLSGGDDGFGGEARIADLDRDGLPEVLIPDFDADIPGCSRRMHLYHHRGVVSGGADVLLREERQAFSSGWVGAIGFTADDLDGTYDVAVIDVDGDGADDLVLGRCGGTDAWRSLLPTCSATAAYGVGCPGASGAPPTLGLFGDVCAGATVALAIEGGPPGGAGLLLLGAASAWAPAAGVCSFHVAPALVLPLSLGPIGATFLAQTVPAGLAPGSVFLQALTAEPTLPWGYAASKGLEIRVH